MRRPRLIRARAARRAQGHEPRRGHDRAERDEGLDRRHTQMVASERHHHHRQIQVVQRHVPERERALGSVRQDRIGHSGQAQRHPAQTLGMRMHLARGAAYMTDLTLANEEAFHQFIVRAAVTMQTEDATRREGRRVAYLCRALNDFGIPLPEPDRPSVRRHGDRSADRVRRGRAPAPLTGSHPRRRDGDGDPFIPSRSCTIVPRTVQTAPTRKARLSSARICGTI